MFNQAVLDLIKTYPTNGTHKYHWADGFDGVTQDLIHQGITIAKTDALHQTYCCGLTYEVYFRVATQLGVKLPPPQDMKRIKSDWFVATGKRKGPVDALVIRGLGVEIGGRPAWGFFTTLAEV
jgi:hypothetical protein